MRWIVYWSDNTVRPIKRQKIEKHQTGEWLHTLSHPCNQIHILSRCKTPPASKYPQIFTLHFIQKGKLKQNINNAERNCNLLAALHLYLTLKLLCLITSVTVGSEAANLRVRKECLWTNSGGKGDYPPLKTLSKCKPKAQWLQREGWPGATEAAGEMLQIWAFVNQRTASCLKII